MELVNLEQLKTKFNPHFLHCVEEHNGTLPEKVVIRKIPAKSLLFHPSRFDLMIKYLYIDFWAKGIELPFSEELYAIHLQNNHGEYFEGDGRKHSLKDYKEQFHNIIDSIKRIGFDENTSIIPVNTEGSCLDGSHRIAASAFFDENITIAEFEYPSHAFSSENLRHNRKISEDSLDFVALNYCILNNNSYIVNLRPSAPEEYDLQTEYILRRYGHIYYKKNIKFTFHGAVLREYLFYKTEKWIGSPEDNFSGAQNRALQSNNGPIRIYLIECPSLDEVKKAKQAIRAIYDAGNEPIHITDTRDETLDLARLYFNRNSLHLFNNQKAYPHKTFLVLLNSFRHWLDMKGINYDNVVVDGSSVLELYGLRTTKDIDYLKFNNGNSLPENELFDSHDSELKYHAWSKNELLFDPRRHLYFEGIKFVSLDTLKEMKKTRSEVPKDIADLKLIDKVYSPSVYPNFFAIFRAHKKFLIGSLKRNLKTFFLSVLPENTYRRSIAKQINNLRRTIIWSLSNYRIIFYRLVPGEIHNINYYGYRLYFSKKTSIVERYLEQGSYEPRVINTLFSLLDAKDKAKKLLDIGANIGMISLPLISRYEDLIIYAFEPGPHQRRLFQKTIDSNNLTDRIFLFEFALSDKCGQSPFTIHATEHASGNGFFDTARAGNSTTIKVVTRTLDDWWCKIGKMKIDLVKLDIEGAELLVLQGGKEFISHVSPVILFELNSDNLKPYSYGASDILEFFKSQNYDVRNLDFSSLGGNQYTHILSGNYSGDFVAMPKLK